MEVCTYCASVIIDKRSNALYCSDNCRSKACQHKKRIEDKQKPLRASLHALDNQLTEVLVAVADCTTLLEKNQEKLQEVEKQWKEKNHLYHMHYEKYRIEELGYLDQDYSYFIPKEINRTANNLLYLLTVQEGKSNLKKEINHLAAEHKKLKEEKKQCEQELAIYSVEFDQIKEKMAQLEASLAALEQRKQKSPVKRKKAAKAQPHSLQEGISVKAFMQLQFETLRMPKGLGTFLGQLDLYQLSIALTGNPGAGKSYFLAALAKLFSYMGFSLCYFQLEQGLGKIMQNILQAYPVNPKNVVLKESATLEDIRQAAQGFDGVLIDSFGKVSADARVFDALRKEFPNTIFISIFQKNSDGSTRGGSRIDYDSSMIIDVIRRDNRPVAIMRKSRYGTQGWEYDVKDDQIIKRFE